MIGHCHCPCDQWPGHDGSTCTGGFERMLPKYPYLDGVCGLPICQPCYAAIQAVTDRRSILPPPASIG